MNKWKYNVKENENEKDSIKNHYNLLNLLNLKKKVALTSVSKGKKGENDEILHGLG